MKKYISTFFIILIFVIGLSVLLYPTLSNLVNQKNASKLIASYEEAVASLSQEDYDKILSDAYAYNERLRESNTSYPTGMKNYGALLNITGNGLMGYIEIKKIDVKLPVFHTTSEAVLKAGIGHLEATSLPVGGKGTHSAISGHRGLPSAKLFTDLDEIIIGDTFYLYICDEVLAYEVDEIKTVEPYEAHFVIEKDKDYVTLVTCTPYGINTHRLLIRGHRVAYESTIAKRRVNADAFMVDAATVAPIIAAPVIIALLVFLLVKSSRNKRRRRARVRYGVEETARTGEFRPPSSGQPDSDGEPGSGKGDSS